MNRMEMDRDLKRQHDDWMAEFMGGPHNSPKRSVSFATLGHRRRRRLTTRSLRLLQTAWQPARRLAEPARKMRGVHLVMAQQSMVCETTQRAVGSI